MTEHSPLHSSSVWSDAVDDYQALAEPHTRQFARLALQLAGGVAQGERVLDVAAGTGALTLEAAMAGASVLATDFSAGMVGRLSERLRDGGFTSCEARVMDGQALELPDGAFNVAFSVFGVMLFPQWEVGLRELHRVVRPGGRVVMVTWGQEEGAGPAVLFHEAWRATFPDRTPPSFPDGLRALSRPESLKTAFQTAGSTEIEVQAAERDWVIPSAAWLGDNADRLFRQFPGWVALDDADRERLRAWFRAANGDRVDQPLPVPSRALIAVGRKAD